MGTLAGSRPDGTIPVRPRPIALRAAIPVAGPRTRAVVGAEATRVAGVARIRAVVEAEVILAVEVAVAAATPAGAVVAEGAAAVIAAATTETYLFSVVRRAWMNFNKSLFRALFFSGSKRTRRDTVRPFEAALQPCLNLPIGMALPSFRL